nr:sigma-70 family RNA polymerase sigma factor [Gluconacetobacter aggeris]
MTKQPLTHSRFPDPLTGLFQSHFGWLVSRMARQLGSRSKGEEIASEVFVRLAASRQAENLREPRAFLLVVARRLIAELRRRSVLEASYLDALRAVSAETAPSPEEHNAFLQLLQRMDHALHGVSPKARAAFFFYRIDHLRHQDIAERLNVSVSMVRKYIDTAERACAGVLDRP